MRVAALRLLALLRERYAAGRAAIPDTRWRAWLRTIVAGAAGMFLLMAALRFGAERLLLAGRLNRETSFLRSLIFERPPFGFSTAVFLQTFGSDITLAILLIATATTAVLLRRPITACSLILAFMVPDLVGRFGWLIWDRARPTLLHEGFASPGFHSFPSGHTSKTIAVYGLLAWLWIRASGSFVEKLIAILLALGIMLAVPFGRMVMGVHWPSDVIGGAVIGLVWLVVLGAGLRFEGEGVERRDHGQGPGPGHG